MKRNIRIACLLAVMILLPAGLCACSDPNLAVEEYSMIVTEDDISQLDMFPNLKYADLRGSTCYEAIESYIASHPNVQVRYSIQFGKKRIDSTTTELSLNCENIAFDELVTSLPYLKNLNKAFLSNINYSIDQIDQLKNTYPQVEFEYSVLIGRKTYSNDATAVDLSQLSAQQIDYIIEALRKLPNVVTVELMNPSGSTNWAMEDVKRFHDTFPHISFHYSFQLFNRTISTTDELITYTGVSIGNLGLPELRSALEILSGSNTLILDDCGIDDSTLASLQDEFQNIKIVWRLHFGKYSILTNAEMLRMTKAITDKNSTYLKYCTNLKYMDLTDNPNLTNFSFIESMPELKAVVLSGTKINDLSVFESCNNLEWLDLYGCKGIKDITPLSELSNLKYLNISYTSVSDLTPILNHQMKQFVCIKAKVSADQQKKFTESQPDCLSRFTGTKPQVMYWQYLDGKNTYSPYYEALIPIFHYDDPKFKGNTE